MELETKSTNHPKFIDTFTFWFKLGFISFGGPAGQISIMHETVVVKKKWVSEEKFLNALNYCMLLPGPEAQQLATYIGWLLHGIRGGLTAGILFILPGALLLLLLSVLYVQFNQLLIVNQFFYGLKISVVGIVIVATINIARKSLKSKGKLFIAILAFLYMSFFKFPMPYLILCILLLGILLPNNKSPLEFAYKKDPYQFNLRAQVRLKYFFSLLVGFLFLGICPFLILSTTNNGDFWKLLITFFTKTSLITFGGAYAVLPYVADQSVNSFHWLTSSQMIDGLALGETTPGPLVIVLSFVAFMAGFNTLGGSILSASLAMLIATYYTFLPSFFFIFAGAPFIESLLHIERLKRGMEFVSAGIVGLIASLALTILLSVSFKSSDFIQDWTSIDIFSLIWMAITIYALSIKKWNMILWIFVSAMAGMIYLNLKYLYT